MLGDWLMVALGVLLTAGTAVFVASEFSLVTLDPAVLGTDGTDDGGTGGTEDGAGDDARGDEGASRRDRRDGSVRAGLRHLSTELSSAQVGITLTTVLLGYTA